MEEDRLLSRSERRKLTMRHHISAAAANLFAQKGFHKTTTKDIAKAADVSEGSIYNYFENKEDILFGVIEILVIEEQRIFKFIPSLTDDPVDYLFSRFMHQQEKVAKKNPILQAIVSEIVFNNDLRQRYQTAFLSPFMDLVSDHFKSRMELGQIKNFPPQHLTRILFSLLIGLYFFDMLEDNVVKDEWKELSYTAVNVLFEGLKAEPK